jgi:hypothetical protein
MDAWHTKHWEEIKAYKRKYNAEHRDKVRVWNKHHRDTHKAQTKARNRRYVDKLRREVYAAYGGVCALCGARKNLGLDHINGNGREERKRLHKPTGWAFYSHVRRLGFPKENYRLLCGSCNTREWYRSKGHVKKEYVKKLRACPKCDHQF